MNKDEKKKEEEKSCSFFEIGIIDVIAAFAIGMVVGNAIKK